MADLRAGCDFRALSLMGVERSGTTGVACATLGKTFVGVEINPTYFDMACERISSAYAQGRLFA